MQFPQITDERLKELRETIQLLKRDTRSGVLHYLDQTGVNPWKTDITQPGLLGKYANDVAQFYAIEISLYLPYSHLPAVTVAEVFSQFDQAVPQKQAPQLIMRTVSAIELWHGLHIREKEHRTEAWLLLYKSSA